MADSAPIQRCQHQQRHRSCSFRGGGVDVCQGGSVGAAAADRQGTSSRPLLSPPKRFSLSDAAPLSPGRQQRVRLSPAAAAENSEVFDRRLEDSLRDLRVMQARMARSGAGKSSQSPQQQQQQAAQQQHSSGSPLPTSPDAQTPDCDSSPRGPVARQRAMSLATSVFGGRELTAPAGHRSLTSLIGGGGRASSSAEAGTPAMAAAAASAAAADETGGSASRLAGGGNGSTGGGSGCGEYRREKRRASMQDAIDASQINADLYSKVYNQPNVIQSIQEENLGQLNFSIGYKEDTGILTVRIIQAIDLQPKDSSTGSANPYCRVAVLPNRRTQTTTKVHKKTLRPEFEESFIFELGQQDIQWSVLEVTVFDYDPCSLDDCLGQVKLPLVDLLDADSIADTQALWKGLTSLEKDPDPEHKIGDLMFSLSFLPAAKRLSVSIIKARNLRDINKDRPMTDTAVRVALTLSSHGDGKKHQKRKKTSCSKTPSNPVWEEALVFNGVAEADLRTGCLNIAVCHEGLLTSTEFGRVYLGPDTCGHEYQHWWNMLKSKAAPARWHRLAPVLAKQQ